MGSDSPSECFSSCEHRCRSGCVEEQAGQLEQMQVRLPSLDWLLFHILCTTLLTCA